MNIPYGYIYGLRCRQNGKWYIGQTTQKPYYYIKNQYQYRKSNRRHKIENAIRKYGFSNFDICLLDSAFNKEDLDILEGSYMSEYDSITNGYNIREAGSHGKMSIESIEKQKISLKEHWKTHIHPWIGRHHSDETKIKISENNKGRNPTQRQLEGLKRGHNRIKSKDECLKISMILRGLKKSESHKEKISKSRIEKGLAKGSNNPRAKKLILVNKDTGQEYSSNCAKELIKSLGMSYAGFLSAYNRDRKTEYKGYIIKEYSNANIQK